MSGTTTSVKGVLADLPPPIIPKIGREPIIEALIELHRLISVNVASVASDIRGGRNRHITLTKTVDYYMAQTGYTFVPPRNPGNFPPMMGTYQEKALRNERFQKNKNFQKMHHHGRSTKKEYHHGSTTSIPICTGGIVGGIRKGDCATNAPAPLQLLWGNKRNQPQGKYGEDDGAV